MLGNNIYHPTTVRFPPGISIAEIYDIKISNQLLDIKISNYLFLKYGKFECQKDIHFKIQPGPAAKNATPRPLAGNRTCDPGSLDLCYTD